jgi:hypothetical protein
MWSEKRYLEVREGVFFKQMIERQRDVTPRACSAGGTAQKGNPLLALYARNEPTAR